MTFDDFDFEYELLDGLNAMGFDEPTPIQAQAIPVILDNKDLIACAQTGTGKTAAYLLPILNKIIIAPDEIRHLNTLVLAPTRELAIQIDQQIEGLGYFTGVSSIAIYGGGDGAAWSQQRRALADGGNVIIATPGRLIALLQMGEINFKHLQHLILDEADRMLDMGFYDDIIKIISYLPSQRQTLLFSATMPPKIRTLAKTILQNPEQISIAVAKPAEGILQQIYMAYDAQKIPLLKHILKEGSYESIIIFASTKENVKKLNEELRKTKIKAKAFHSDLEQKEREEILREFKSRALPILIGTDILSRGIDVEGIDLVVNFDAPHDPEDYIHRIGRTARAATTGTAVTFINEKDQKKLAAIERLIGKELPKLALPASLGDAPVYKPASPNKKPKSNKRPFRRGGHSKGPKSTPQA
ncbi:DEAD/DEAH box helicase [Runella limosa]|uniref:DEAD/DEAH box helicase n=1 Tax=Runella limosa TaxID=370978 RepID=UPI0003F7CB97|nr:DEAD/DEAH box helicase [Runella limosa]MCA0230644.1 DEAD/DEAH box helicase [Bacteroidota bacterium]